MPRLPFLDFRSRSGRTYAFILVAIAGLGWAAYAMIEAAQPATVFQLRLGAGSTVERRYQIARHLADEAEHVDVDVELVSTSGLDDALAKLSTHQIDSAIVSLGLRVDDIEHIKVLAALDVAPLHILARREFSTSGSLVEILKGRRINLGRPGTNDHALGLEVLKFLRLGNQYTEVNWTKDQLSHRAEEVVLADSAGRSQAMQEFPDVVMLVGSLPSPIVQRLLDTGEYELVPFPYASNFLMSDSNSQDQEIMRRFVEPTQIPAAMYLGKMPAPVDDCPSLGLRSLLVARADLPEAMVERIMTAVFDTSFARRIKPLLPNRVVKANHIHSAATAYVERKEPLLTGAFFEQFSDGLSIFGAFTAGALSLYGYLRRRRIRSPGEYLEEIRNVDSLVCERNSETGELKTPAAIAREIDARLVKLKKNLIEDYCNNRVQGELVLMSILSMLSDSRAQLQRSTGRIDLDVAEIQAEPPCTSRAA